MSTTTNSNNNNNMEENKFQRLLEQLLGTWTLETSSQADLGYYKGKAFVVMHFMPDPLQVHGCYSKDCHELENQICTNTDNGGMECVDTATNIVEWSQVAAFFQFGIEIDVGFPFRTHVVQNTSGWLGPYNWLLPNADHSSITSRYVATPSTNVLRLPPANCTIVDPKDFDQYAGVSAVHNTIVQQTNGTMDPTVDPFSNHKGHCDKKTTLNNGEKDTIHPLLPQLQLSKKRLQFKHFLWTLLPQGKKDPMYKIWPTLQKHLPEFPVVGPYCYQGDPHGAYALNVSLDTRQNNSWHLTEGCVANLPCWQGEHLPGNKTIPTDGGDGTAGTDWSKALLTYGSYSLLLGLLVSLAFNFHLSGKLKRHQDEATMARNGRPVRTGRRRRRGGGAGGGPTNRTRRDELEEPLLPATNTSATTAITSPVAEEAAESDSGAEGPSQPAAAQDGSPPTESPAAALQEDETDPPV